MMVHLRNEEVDPTLTPPGLEEEEEDELEDEDARAEPTGTRLSADNIDKKHRLVKGDRENPTNHTEMNTQQTTKAPPPRSTSPSKECKKASKGNNQIHKLPGMKTRKHENLPAEATVIKPRPGLARLSVATVTDGRYVLAPP